MIPCSSEVTLAVMCRSSLSLYYNIILIQNRFIELFISSPKSWFYSSTVLLLLLLFFLSALNVYLCLCSHIWLSWTFNWLRLLQLLVLVSSLTTLKKVNGKISCTFLIPPLFSLKIFTYYCMYYNIAYTFSLYYHQAVIPCRVKKC